MTFSQLMASLRARWLAAAVALVLVVGAVMGVTLLLPKRYAASSVVLVDFKNPDPITGLASAGAVQTSFMVTQVDLIRSGRVVRRVIERMQLNRSDALRADWAEATEGRGEFEAWLTELLRRDLEVRPTRDSGALSITYTSGDPAFSAAVSNAFASALVEVNLELRTDPARQFSGFFDERSKAARDALEAAQAKRSEYLRSQGLIATDERFDIETARLQELSSQVVMLQALAAESAGRSAQAGSNSDRMQEVLNNSLVSSLTADLSRQQARLEELGARLGDANPQVVELRASIDELRRRIAAETSRVAGSVGVNNSVTQARLAQVQAALAEQRARVLRLKQLRDEAAVLERDVETARLAYQNVVQKATQTTLESQANQSNVSIIERAPEPLNATFPNVLLNAALALVLGVVIALATALVREWRDRRLRTLDDVTDVLQIPLLGVVPRATAKVLQAGTMPASLIGSAAR